MVKASSRKNRTPLDRRLLIDIAVRVTLSLFFAFAAGIYGRNAVMQLQGVDMTQLNPTSFSRGLSIFSIALYTLMIAGLYVLRLRPINKFAGFWPSAAALLGGFMMFGLVLFEPRTDLPLSVQVFASLMVLTGNIFMIIVLTRLGRSFSILPESRKLVTTGPYAVIRHPLYAAEFLAMFGTTIFFLSPGAVALIAVQSLMQLARIHYEEQVLTKNFPDYKKYARRTSRLIPGIY